MEFNSLRTIENRFASDCMILIFKFSESDTEKYRYSSFAFRLNEGNVARHTMEQLESLVKATVGRQITYKELVA